MPIQRVMVAIMHASSGRHPFGALFGASNVSEFDPLAFGKRASEEFISRAVAFRPGWIHMQVQDSGAITAQAIHKVRELLPRTVISHWMGDVRRSISPYLAEVCRATHVTLISSKGQIKDYLGVGATRVAYHQVGLDFKTAVMSGKDDWEPSFRVPDVVFCGNAYNQNMFPGHSDRDAVVKAFARSEIDFGVIGTGWSGVPVIGRCDVQHQQFVYKRAKLALSVNHFNDIELYYSDRHLHALFSGVATLCKYVPGLETEFRDGIDCVFFRTPEQALASARRLLSAPEERLKIGRAGRAEAIRRHTFIGRVLDVYPLIEEISDAISASPESALVSAPQSPRPGTPHTPKPTPPSPMPGRRLTTLARRAQRRGRFMRIR